MDANKSQSPSFQTHLSLVAQSEMLVCDPYCTSGVAFYVNIATVLCDSNFVFIN